MKYSGVILLLLLVVAAAYSYDKMSEPPRVLANGTGLDERNIRLAIQKAQSIAEQQPQLDSLQQRMSVVQKSSNAFEVYTNLISLPRKEVKIVQPVAEPIRPKLPTRYNYTLTMVYIAADDKYAVINGEFSREGGVLSSGAKVLNISKGKVKVVRRGIVQTVKLKGS